MKKARRARATKVVRHFIDEIVRAEKPIFSVFSNSPITISPLPLGQSCLCNCWMDLFGPHLSFEWQMLREGEEIYWESYFWLDIIQLCRYILWIQSYCNCWPKQTPSRVKMSTTASYLICQICANPNANAIMGVTIYMLLKVLSQKEVSWTIVGMCVFKKQLYKYICVKKQLYTCVCVCVCVYVCRN